MDAKTRAASSATWFTTDHVALVVSIAALAATLVTLYYLWRSTKASEASARAADSSAKASEASASSSIVSARAAEESVTVAKGLLKIEQDREYERLRPKLSGCLVPERITGTGTNAWLEVHLDASTPGPLRGLLLTLPAGAQFGRGGVSLPGLNLGFPGEPGQVPPVRPGRPARWRVYRAESADGTVTATAKCTSEDGTVWANVEVPISQDYEDSDRASG